MIVYKYRRDADTTAKIFTTKKVWLSTPAALNDPFESELHAIDAAWRTAKVTEMKQAQLAGFLHEARRGSTTGDFFGLTQSQVRELLERFHTLRDFDEAYAAFCDFFVQRLGNAPSDPEKVFSLFQEQMSAVGIFSLSEVPDHPLMWAHYAEDHKGLCLGFEVTDRSALADRERCLHVEYSDSLPKMGEGFRQQLTLSLDDRGKLEATSRIAFSDPAVRAAISTKGSEWEYEREWRYVESLAGEYDWPGPIVEITFGLRCPGERREYYSKLVQEFVPNDVRFYEMRRVPDTKALERVRLSASFPRSSSAPHAAQVVPSIREIESLLENRRYLDALPMSEQLLTVAPDSAELWRLKGIALGWSEDHVGALACFERAITLQPEFFSAWYHKAVALTALDRYDEAIDAYLEAQGLWSGEPSVSFNLGVILVHLKRYEEAAVHLRTAHGLGHPRAADQLKAVEALHGPAR